MSGASPRRPWLATAVFLSGSLAGADDGWKVGPGASLSRPSADLRVSLTGYLQSDFRSFPNWEVDESEGSLRNDQAEVRRLRVGFEGKWRRLGFEFDADPREEGDHLKDAYLELRLNKRLRIRGGHFKVPVSPEFLTSAGKLDFVERSLLADVLGPSRDFGVMAHGDLRRLTYQVGVFAGDGRADVSRAETTAAARVVVTALDGLDLAASFSQGDVQVVGDARGVQPDPKGFAGDSPSGFRYYVRHHVNGRRLRLGVDAVYSRGPWALKAEGLQARERRLGQGALLDDLPEEVGTGWAVSGTWLVTGEKKDRTIKPRRSLPGGPGAVEVGVRYESLRFDDDGPSTGFEGVGNRARNIRPAADRVLTGGVSWWPERWLRLTGNLAAETYLDPLLAPEQGRKGTYLTLLGRVQIQVP